MLPGTQFKRCAVAIVGAGPTGLAAANLLGMAGIETLLIERNAGPGPYPRAITIDDEGLRICQAMGLLDPLRSALLLGLQAHYLAHGRLLARVGSMLQHNGYPLISTFHQPVLETILLEGLTRFPCVESLFQHTLIALEQDEQRALLTLNTPTNSSLRIACDYVLACDGGKSALRQALNISMYSPGLFSIFHSKNGKRTGTHKQRWLVVDCANDTDTTDCAIFFCNPARPAVTVPAPGRGRRWEFMLLPGEREEAMLTPEAIDSLVKQVRASLYRNSPSPDTIPPPHIVRRAIYTFHTALARDFISGRVFLLGDAAHLMPPFGGQGMNSGLRDAFNLCWKLALVLHKHFHPRLLATYQQERQPHAAHMIRFSSLLGALIMPRNPLFAMLRDTILRLFNAISPLRSMLTEARVKPHPRYTRGCLIPSRGWPGQHLSGKLLPQPFIRTSEGIRLPLDELLGSNFAVLKLCKDQGDVFAALHHQLWQRLDARFICIYPPGSSLPQTTCTHAAAVIDETGILQRWHGRHHNHYILVRPDRYIVGVFTIKQEARFADTLLQQYLQ